MNSGKHGLAAPILHTIQLAHLIPGFVKIFGSKIQDFSQTFFKTKISFSRALPNHSPTHCLSIPSLVLSLLPIITFNPFSLPYHTSCLRITIALPLHYQPPTSCLTIPLGHALLSSSPALPPLTRTLYPFFHALLHPTSMLYSIFTLYLTIAYSYILLTLSLCLTTPFFFALLSPTPPSYTTILTNYLDSFVI